MSFDIRIGEDSADKPMKIERKGIRCMGRPSPYIFQDEIFRLMFRCTYTLFCCWCCCLFVFFFFNLVIYLTNICLAGDGNLSINCLDMATITSTHKICLYCKFITKKKKN